MTPIDALLKDHQALHSDLQIDAWILNQDNWTPYGRYQQALRELRSRRNSLESIEAEIALAELDREELAEEQPANVRDIKRQSIRMGQKDAALREMRASRGELRRELERFQAAATSLRDEIGPLDAARRAVLDRETWTARVRMMAAIDLATSHRIGPSVIRMLVAAPEEWRRPVLCDLREPAKLLSMIQ